MHKYSFYFKLFLFLDWYNLILLYKKTIIEMKMPMPQTMNTKLKWQELKDFLRIKYLKQNAQILESQILHSIPKI